MPTRRTPFDEIYRRQQKAALVGDCSSCPLRKKAIYRCAPHRHPDPIEQLRLRQVSGRKNQVILPLKNSAGAIFTVKSGWVARFRPLRDGSRQILSFLLPGDVVKAEALTGPASPLHRAMCDTVLCEFDSDSLLRYLTSEPDTSIDLMSQCQRDKGMLDETIISLAKRSAEERLARLFLEIRIRLFSDVDDAPLTFHTPLRRDDISDALGLTPVHVSRILGGMRSSRILHFKRGLIEIVDLAKLKALAAAR